MGGLWGTYHPELACTEHRRSVDGPLPSRSTRSAAWSTPPGLNIKLSTQANHANQNMWKLPYLGLFFPLKYNPEQIGQSPSVAVRPN